MYAKKLKFASVFLLLIALLAFALPSPVIADGGPAVNYDLWSRLEEGHQTGIISIIDENSARVTLFISILDRTGVSHEVTFFVPIGKNATSFAAYEQDLRSFNQNTTNLYDQRLRGSADRKQQVVQALFTGTLLTNGGIFTPLWAPLLLTGCGAGAQQPESVITTDSSEISIYNIDDNTNIDTLIQTTGLAPAVADTLSGLKGQKIAIVKLQTKTAQPPKVNNNDSYYQPPSEPGLRLFWNTEPIVTDKGKTFTYPLGTGAAWSKPIELTRVYVTSPQGLDFDVQYPKLGEKHSGYSRVSGANILGFTKVAAYAIDEARDPEGHVWRAIYTQSNPTDNVVITMKPESGFSRFQASTIYINLWPIYLFAFIIAILVWVLAWQYILPLFLKKDPDYTKIKWYEALLYPAVNIVFIIVPGAIIYLMFLIGLGIPALMAQFLVSAGVSIGFFLLVHRKRLGVRPGKAFGAFILTSLSSSAVYMLLAVGFAFLVGAV
jgi:hypothetical protein